eukprot:1513405-Lingulodinium_polyedra.AAC.1
MARGHPWAMRKKHKPNVKLRAPGVGAFGTRAFTPAIADKASQRIGHVWAVRPELRGLLGQPTVCRPLSGHAS